LSKPLESHSLVVRSLKSNAASSRSGMAIRSMPVEMNGDVLSWLKVA
jgi:hypothetical protein